MKNFVLVLFLLVTGLFFTACSKQEPSQQVSQSMQRVMERVSGPSKEVSPTPTIDLPFSATFEIYTTGTKRTFTQAMYHQQSEDVFITAEDPNLVHVTKQNVTWEDFFATLPFSVTQECLVTGTGQRFCSSTTHELIFMLNGEQDPQALQKQILPADHLEIRYQIVET